MYFITLLYIVLKTNNIVCLCNKCLNWIESVSMVHEGTSVLLVLWCALMCSDVLWGIMYHYSWLFLTSILLLYVNNCLGSLRCLLVGRLTCVWSYTRTCRETIWVEGLPVSYSNISSRLYRNQVLSIYKYMYIYIIYRLHLQAGSGTQTWIVSL
mgnify:CR=1 FL=1